MLALVTGLIHRAGAAAVFLLMLVENVFPPLPSELILPFAGYAAARGGLSFWGAVVAGGAGSVLGAWAWYEGGRRVGEARLMAWAARRGRWLAVTPGELARALHWMRRHPAAALVIGRMLPGVRGVICIPAGVAGMARGAFLLWCSLGSFGWSLLLCSAGRLLAERYALVDRWINPTLTAAFAAMSALYVARVAALRRRR